MDISLTEQIDDAVRELARRTRAYPSLVKSGTLDAGEATYQRRVQEAILWTLRWVASAQRQLPLFPEGGR